MLFLTEIHGNSTGNIYPDSFFDKLMIFFRGLQGIFINQTSRGLSSYNKKSFLQAVPDPIHFFGVRNPAFCLIKDFSAADIVV